MEQRLQLLCSDWQRRLWTLQGARLATNAWIQFKDGAVAVHVLSEVSLGIQLKDGAVSVKTLSGVSSEQAMDRLDDSDLLSDVFLDTGRRVGMVTSSEAEENLQWSEELESSSPFRGKHSHH